MRAPESPMPEPASEPKRPPLKAELFADNKEFIRLAKRLLHAFRGTDDRSCCLCGAEVGEQHRRGHECRELVLWRAATQYKEAGNDNP